MKANELRIDNWYHADIIKENVFEKITAKDIVDLFDDPLDDYYKAIQLTDEIIFKFGFEKKESRRVYTRDDLCFCLIKNDHNKGYTLGYLKEDSFFGISTNIYYVHHLQNIIFDLTGNEDKIDLTI
jgi:hypothetical protein